jgi:hypothetical protein
MPKPILNTQQYPTMQPQYPQFQMNPINSVNNQYQQFPQVINPRMMNQQIPIQNTQMINQNLNQQSPPFVYPQMNYQHNPQIVNQEQLIPPMTMMYQSQPNMMNQQQPIYQYGIPQNLYQQQPTNFFQDKKSCCCIELPEIKETTALNLLIINFFVAGLGTIITGFLSTSNSKTKYLWNFIGLLQLLLFSSGLWSDIVHRYFCFHTYFIFCMIAGWIWSMVTSVKIYNKSKITPLLYVNAPIIGRPINTNVEMPIYNNINSQI